MEQVQMTQEKLIEALPIIILEAEQAAKAAADEVYSKHGDNSACGFAWVVLCEFDGKQIKGNTKLGKALKKAGVEQNWQRLFSIWNPSGHGAQSVNIKEAGANAAALIFRKYGITAYGSSRLD